MDDDARRRIRRAMLAKQAASPKLRGQYKRAMRAARLEKEAHEQTEFGPRTARVRQPESLPPVVPPPKRKSPARWVIALAALPVLLVLAVGAYALNVVIHAERAANKIAQDALPRGPQGVVSTNTTQATNTPNAQGIIATLPPTVRPTPIPTEAPPINFDRKDPFTIMMLGVDTRDGDTDPSRSDTIIIAYVDPLEKHVNMLSIPRDLLVTQAGGFGQAKMSDVYANGEINKYVDPTRGGIALVRDTIEQNFRIQIDYYAQVDFNGFKKIVDAFGGVTVDNPYPLKDDEYPTEDYQFKRVFFPAGLIHLYGDEALEFARTRHDDNDFQRNNRQQQVILGIRQQALQLNLLSKATSLIDTLGDSVRTDFPRNQWIGFAKFGTDVQGSAIQQFTLTDLLQDTTINGGYYATIDWNKAITRAKEFRRRRIETPSPRKPAWASIRPRRSSWRMARATAVSRTAGLSRSRSKATPQRPTSTPPRTSRAMSRRRKCSTSVRTMRSPQWPSRKSLASMRIGWTAKRNARQRQVTPTSSSCSVMTRKNPAPHPLQASIPIRWWRAFEAYQLDLVIVW